MCYLALWVRASLEEGKRKMFDLESRTVLTSQALLRRCGSSSSSPCRSGRLCPPERKPFFVDPAAAGENETLKAWKNSPCCQSLSMERGTPSHTIETLAFPMYTESTMSTATVILYFKTDVELVKAHSVESLSWLLLRTLNAR